MMITLIAATMLAGSDAWLIQREHDKWESLERTRKVDVRPFFAPDLVNIGYFPDGPHRTGLEAFADLDKITLPKGAITLSDFKVIRLGNGGAVVTYFIHDKVGPLGEGFVTSVWAKRGGKWLTVFYQATAGARKNEKAG